jgi:hypothetical protein
MHCLQLPNIRLARIHQRLFKTSALSHCRFESTYHLTYDVVIASASPDAAYSKDEQRR